MVLLAEDEKGMEKSLNLLQKWCGLVIKGEWKQV